MKSYTSASRGPIAFLRETIRLLQSYRRDVENDVADIVRKLRELERLVADRYDVELRGLRMLDVGAGQRLLQMTYFAAKGNEVVGIDRDVIVRGWDLRGYLRMLRENGLKRTVKTIARKLLGIDRRYSAELRRQLGAREPRRLPVYRMEADELDFPDESFDAVYSLAVFMHVDRPHESIAEIARVLKPGGVAYIDLVPYTGHIGALDIRSIAGTETGLPLWAHLRPEYREEVQESAYVNRIRLRDWERLFGEGMPGSDLVYVRPEEAELEPEARRLQAEGALTEYGVDELVTSKLAVLWRKPS